MRRVVVTGMGMLSPFGRGVEYNWDNIVAGKSFPSRTIAIVAWV